jgi:hypothetical protein
MSRSARFRRGLSSAPMAAARRSQVSSAPGSTTSSPMSGSPTGRSSRVRSGRVSRSSFTAGPIGLSSAVTPTVAYSRSSSSRSSASCRDFDRTWRAAHGARAELPTDGLGARRVGKLFGLLRWKRFFREACGPGWVLVGDAGHFKDPTPAAGIQDAFRQAETLAPVITDGINESPANLDKTISQWGRWRDRDAAEHYWFACDMGAAGAVPTVLPELMRRLLEHDRIGLFLDLLTHRSKPSQVLTPPRVLGATGRLLARPGTDRRALVREVCSLIANDARRRRLNRRPAYRLEGEARREQPRLLGRWRCRSPRPG